MNRDILRIELEHERRLADSEFLSPFRRNATTWELLLLLAADDARSEEGLYRLSEAVETDYLSKAALLKFMRDQRHEGRLLFEPHTKRSMWRVVPHAGVLEELRNMMSLRNRQLAGADRSRGDHGAAED